MDQATVGGLNPPSMSWPTDTTKQEKEFPGVPFPIGIARDTTRAYTRKF